MITFQRLSREEDDIACEGMIGTERGTKCTNCMFHVVCCKLMPLISDGQPSVFVASQKHLLSDWKQTNTVSCSSSQFLITLTVSDCANQGDIKVIARSCPWCVFPADISWLGFASDTVWVSFSAGVVGTLVYVEIK